MFQVDVFIAPIIYFKDSRADISTSNCRQNKVGLIKIESRVASLSLNANFHVAN